MGLVVVGLLLSLDVFVSGFRSKLSQFVVRITKQRKSLLPIVIFQYFLVLISGQFGFWTLLRTEAPLGEWWHFLLAGIWLSLLFIRIQFAFRPRLARYRIGWVLMCFLAATYSGLAVLFEKLGAEGFLLAQVILISSAQVGYWLIFRAPAKLASWLKNEHASIYLSVLCIALASAIQIFVLSP